MFRVGACVALLLFLLLGCDALPCNIDDDCPNMGRCSVGGRCLPEGAECFPGEQKSCYTGPQGTLEVASCQAGTSRCDGNKWGPCLGESLPQIERCNNQDDNCDGAIDEVCASQSYCQTNTSPTLLKAQARLLSATELRLTLSLPTDQPAQWWEKPQWSSLADTWSVRESRWDPKQPKQLDLSLRSTKANAPLQLVMTGELLFPNNNNKRCPYTWSSGLITPGCDQGKTLCETTCVDLQIDTTHCGTCGKSCGPDEVCCQGKCANLTTSSQHCGACGSFCRSPSACCQSKCTTFTNNQTHCGACLNTCNAGTTCCGSGCVDLQKDPQHCGVCGKQCKGGERCCQGTCVSFSDPKHCGQCNNSCATLEVCVLGQCFDCHTDADCPSSRFCRKGRCVSCNKQKANAAPTDSRCDQVAIPQSNSNSSFTDVALDKDGAAVVSGLFTNGITLGTQSLNSLQNKADVLVAKLSSQNAWLWAKAAGSDSPEERPQLERDSQGKLYLSALFGSSATFFRGDTTPKQELNGGGHICSVGFDTSGRPDWSTCISGMGTVVRPTKLGGLSTHTGGNTLLSFQMNRATGLSCNNGSPLLPRDDPRSALGVFLGVLAFDSSGKCLWGRSAGSSLARGSLSPKDITYDTSQNGYITGIFRGTMQFGSTTLTNTGDQDDLFVSKLSPTGDFLWTVSLGGDKSETVAAIAADKEGNSYITGTFEGTPTFGQTQLTASLHRDLFVLRLNPKGEVVWAIALGEVGTNEEVADMAISDDGFLFLTGSFQGKTRLGPLRLQAAGSNDRDIFIAKVGPWGRVHWAARAGGSGVDSAHRVVVGASGEIAVVGASQSPQSTFGPITASPPGTSTTKTSGFLWRLRP